jgi:predicted transcriptional regulator
MAEVTQLNSVERISQLPSRTVLTLYGLSLLVFHSITNDSWMVLREVSPKIVLLGGVSEKQVDESSSQAQEHKEESEDSGTSGG